eukprot:TRINITY_DN8559_c0_g1_i1.p1 TRINITY_DN8559_c0_g1~~TRINITY_DN8559_c0_g1_i1.p1  ORF type:complete len:139 (+),score=20.65 TRINITY_DN8559_c0_g1_i1:78-494(+)
MQWIASCCTSREATKTASLKVTIAGATGLKRMNNLADDAPFCVCSIIPENGPQRPSVYTTKTIRNELNPSWNETFTLPDVLSSDSLEFTIYNQGFMGKKVEGKAILKGEQFERFGFEGDLEIPELKGAHLTVCVMMDD